MTPEQEKLFEFTCPECELGTVKATTIGEYPTKIRGHTFVVKNAIIGICNQCMARCFAPEETKRWEKEYQEWLHSQTETLTGHLSEVVHLLETEVKELRQKISVSHPQPQKQQEPTPETANYTQVNTQEVLKTLYQQVQDELTLSHWQQKTGIEALESVKKWIIKAKTEAPSPSIKEETTKIVKTLQNSLEKIARMITTQKPMIDETPEDFRKRMESHPYVAEAQAALEQARNLLL